MSWYCTLDQAKIEQRAKTTQDDDELFDFIRQVSSRIDMMINPHARRPFFEPYDEQRQFMVHGRNIDSWWNVFYFRQPLLAHTGVLLDTTSKTSVVEAFPSGASPYHALRFTSTAEYWYSEVSDGRVPVYVKITGTWGFHGDYDNAWVAYDTLAADLSSSATQMTVNNVDGDDPWGLSPRFSPGALCRIGSEYLRIYATDATGNTVNVRRGVNGSTAAAHSSGDSIEVWQVEEPIRREVARQAAMYYARRGAFEVAQIDAVGVQQYPQDLARALRAAVSEYLNVA